MKYRPEIDGLRAIAVVPVMLFHAGFSAFSGGFVGVDVFFVISGYLITTIIVTGMDDKTFRLRDFYIRRARRIFPALFFVTFLSIVFAWMLFDLREIESFSRTVFGVSTFSANIILWLQDGYFDLSSEMKPLLHTWSLAVEEQYYLFFPVACLLFWRWGIWKLFLAIVIAFIISLLLGDWGSYHRAGAAFYLLPTRAWELLAGALVGIYLYSQPQQILQAKYENLFSLAGLAMILIAVLTFDESTPVPGRYLTVPVLGAVLIILFARQHNTMGKLLSCRLFVGIGLISYSLYLWHQPVFAFARHQGVIGTSGWAIGLLILGLVPVSYLSWRFIELPIRKNPKLMDQVRFTTVSAVTVCLAFTGWFGFDLYIALRYGATHLAVARQYADPGGYVTSRWLNYSLRDFRGDNGKIKVVLIGDSFAQDILNAVEESSLYEHYQLSVYHVSARCGNIWTQSDFSEFISKNNRPMCRKHSRYNNRKLQSLMKQADEIWLASSWKDWQTQFVPETLDRISANFDAQIRVFGTKHLGAGLNFKIYLAELNQGNTKINLPVNLSIVETNHTLKDKVGEDRFVDLQHIICGSGKSCMNTTDDGLLISYDGSHLTSAGAGFLGEQLEDVLLKQ